MEKKDLDARIAEVARSLLSYCRARTSSQYEAEDLAHDIILEIYRSADHIRSPEAIYGFIWAVAGNVYKQWCKARVKRREFPLSEIPDSAAEPDAQEDTALYLLRRELALLSEKYRKAVILYYVENRTCCEIAELLGTSESMVKYLLFKSRKILREGMHMERRNGPQSYNPRGLELLFWGNGANRYYHLCDSIISQNILFACYNDRLTAEQISLEIGVSLPYMEENLNELHEHELLKKEGNRYYTNIVIFTSDFTKEVNAKTAGMREKIADLLTGCVTAHEAEIRAMGFPGADMSGNAFAWQMTCMLLYEAVISILQNRIKIDYPRDKYGTECFIWGAEKGVHSAWASEFAFGISNATNTAGERVQFMDFPLNGEMVHEYCALRPGSANVFLDVASGRTAGMSENDLALAGDMIRRGYITSHEGRLSVNAPVFTAAQHGAIKALMHDTAVQIADEAEQMMASVSRILTNHMPAHLKKTATAMAYLRLFEDAIAGPTALLHSRKFLLPYAGEGILPTTYVILL
ncbi:MAG: RNA polymerase sigma factor [Clostridia bacterium]|nr:RNA polymerase sigma factor [Clostridia bacterium]